jgi:orotidine 5'-phosphate decarboxylase subfamily 2
MFYKKIKNIITKNKSSLCIGLDDPKPHRRTERICSLIDNTEQYSACYKLNPAFYHGNEKQIREITSYLKEKKLLWIYDGKLGDVPHTNDEYAKYVYDVLGADAMTVHPYCGYDSLKHLMREDKGLFILARTTNPSAHKIQNHVSNVIEDWCREDSNLGLVVAGNKEAFAHDIRGRLPNTWFLSPGIGSQGGVIRYALPNTLYSVSRSILNDESPVEKAKQYAEESYFDLMHHLEDKDLVKKSETPFTLASGKKSNLYFDLRGLSSHTDLFLRVAYELSYLVSPYANIMGVATAGIPLATSLATYLNKPFGYVRSSSKEHGTKNLVEGSLSKNAPLVVVDDVVSTGGSLIKAIKTLREQGYVVERAICVVDRGMGGSESLNAIGVDLKSLINL